MIPLTLVFAVLLPNVLGQLVSLLTVDSINNWYPTIRKPSWNPPVWLFPVAWTFLYSCIGLASWLVWSEGGFDIQKVPLQLYATQLGFNLTWPIAFFTLKKPALGMFVNLVTLGLSIATTLAFNEVLPLAGRLMIPYVAWMAFANLLNFEIWRLNVPGHAAESKQFIQGSERAGGSQVTPTPGTPTQAGSVYVDPTFGQQGRGGPKGGPARACLSTSTPSRNISGRTARRLTAVRPRILGRTNVLRVAAAPVTRVPRAIAV